MAATLPGDSWRTRHDMVKTNINSLCTLARLPADCEVFGLFSHLIPADALEREEALERGRKRQGLLPDFKLELPNPLGGTSTTLAELKVLGAVRSRYPRGNRDKAVDRRARLLAGEYRRKVVTIDQQVLGTNRDQVGPLQRRLESFGELQGLVVGAFGEGSEDLHSLVQTLGESRLRAQGLAQGREGSDAELGVIIGQIRRTLSTTAVRAQALCLLSRLSHMGDGARMAAKRRGWARREDERMRAERRAQWVVNVMGRGIIRRGQFLVP